ncbi:MAG: hypothetical protein ABSA12_13825 [Verrucomicrobiia bacterium]|jgi:hypothetical protein
MQKTTLLVARKSSLYLLMVAAVVVAASSVYATAVPETSGGSAELLAVLGIVGVALVLRRKTTKKLPM